MTEPPKITVSHMGICTSDLERSVRFYTEALGFVLDYYLDVGEPFHVLTEMPEIRGRAGFFIQEGIRIELLGYERPDVIGTPERRPMNKIGITHLSFIVDDLEGLVDRIVACGGRVYPETRLELPFGQMIFCTDPDGVRLELWQQSLESGSAIPNS